MKVDLVVYREQQFAVMEPRHQRPVAVVEDRQSYSPTIHIANDSMYAEPILLYSSLVTGPIHLFFQMSEERCHLQTESNENRMDF